jgi:hypothetical protein
MYCLLPLGDAEPISGMFQYMYIYWMKTESELQQGVEQSRDTVNQSDEGGKYAVSSISWIGDNSTYFAIGFLFLFFLLNFKTSPKFYSAYYPSLSNYHALGGRGE